MALRVERIESLGELRAIERQWMELWSRDPAATPFQHPGWLIPWTRRLWGGGTIRALAVLDRDDLVGLAPLFLWGYGRRGSLIRVSFLGAGITDHMDLLALPGYELEAARCVLHHIADADDWQVCDLEEIRPDSPLLRVEAPAGIDAHNAPCSVCPVVALPDTADELYASLNTKFRRNLRLAESRLAKAGAQYQRVARKDCAAAIDALVRLHETRWREREEHGMLAAAKLQRFHREAAARLARQDLVRLYTLRLDGEIVAVQYNLCSGRRVYAYLSGFDPAHAKSSPGMALLSYSIRSAIEDGAAEFDFLRNAEPFKCDWGALDQVNRKLLLSRAAQRYFVA